MGPSVLSRAQLIVKHSVFGGQLGVAVDAEALLLLIIIRGRWGRVGQPGRWRRRGGRLLVVLNLTEHNTI